MPRHAFQLHRRTPQLHRRRHHRPANGTVYATLVVTLLAVALSVGLPNVGPFRTAGTAGAAGALSVDHVVTRTQSWPYSSISSPYLSTSGPNELLVAFVSTNGPNGSPQSTNVSGGGLTWKLAARSNGQAGASEVWTAFATSQVTNITVKARRAVGSYDGMLSVVAFNGAANHVGAVAPTNGAGASPAAQLTTTQANSWVWGVGNDPDVSQSRSVGPNQQLFRQYVDTSRAGTYWAQRQSSATPSAGTSVAITDPSPTGDHWNLSAVEILPAATSPVPPTAADSLWPTAVPVTADAGDPSSVTVGVRFTSDVAGSITGVRFYKAPTNGGTHVGHLFDATGTPLASATFSGETASGWQQVSFASPVAIAPNTVYVASYDDPNGHYSADTAFFATASGTPPLHAVADGSGGAPNGVFARTLGAFPTSGWQQANYWVDVVFQPSTSSSTTSTTGAPTSTTVPPTTVPPTTVPPTTVPPTTVPPTTVPPPPSGSWPGPGNTGVPAGTSLTPSAGFSVNTPGTVINGLDISGCITINVSNVTIRNTRIRGNPQCAGGYVVATGYGNSNIVIQDSEIDGMGVSGGAGICCSGYTLLRVNLHSVGQAGVHVNDNVTVQDSWVHDLIYATGDHIDTIMTNGAMSNLTIRHNRLENNFTQTSVIALFEDFGSITNVWVDNNLLDGGGYTVYAGGNAPAGKPCNNCAFTNNHFMRSPAAGGFWPNGGYWGAVTALDSTITWTGNVWDDNGQPV